MNKVRLPFVYKYKTYDGKHSQASLDISLPFDDECLDEMVTALLNQMDPMMRYLDENAPIEAALRDFIRAENQRLLDEHAQKLIDQAVNGEIDIEALVQQTEKHYKDELLQFADRVGPRDEDIFAQSFHRLVHSSSLEDILKRERDYAKVIADMCEKMFSELEALSSVQQTEMESSISQLDITTTSDDINNLLAQQYSTQNYIRQRYESEIEGVKRQQRHEYRDWITSEVSKVFQTTPVATPLGSRSSMFVSQQPSMEESFTIHLGSQLKHMHNIRIMSANITDLCSPLHAEESFNGMNIALGLYSSSLCGVVVLTPSFQVEANKSILRNANMSTEFHFDQIDDQIEKIGAIVQNISIAGNKQANNNNVKSSPIKSPIPKLQTGDFFITKHSNLAQSHVIFHLISDEPMENANEITSRHPLIMGLRNILKTASRHDITTVTIPALLRHEMSEDMSVQWCTRRAELVFKCAKGFMIESASWGGAELSTLQLLLPYDISEDLFNTLAEMVPSVFRVSNPKILVDNNK